MFKKGEWVAEPGKDKPRIAQVKDSYVQFGEQLIDIVFYDIDGTRLGRLSEHLGGPRGYEPACSAELWVGIEPPNFPIKQHGFTGSWKNELTFV